MTGDEFLKQCDAHGGNWAAMIMSGIRRAFPERYRRMEDDEYDFVQLIKITEEEGVVW